MLLRTKTQRESELPALNLGATGYCVEDSGGRLEHFSNLEGFAAFPVVQKRGTGLLDQHARPALAVDSSAQKLRRTSCFYFPSAGMGWADVARKQPNQEMTCLSIYPTT